MPPLSPPLPALAPSPASPSSGAGEGASLSPRRAVDLSPTALLKAGVTGLLAADVELASAGGWTLATRAEDLSPAAVRMPRADLPVAVVQVMGPLEQRATYQVCGGITDGYDTIEARFNKAVDSVKDRKGRVAVVVDSPGGVTAGGFSSLRRMRKRAEAAGVKVYTVADERAGSMGYAMLLLGDVVAVPPGGRTGSIGTVIVRYPDSDAHGVEVFRSGERKMRPNSIEPLNSEDRTELQAMVDDGAAEFAAWVAERRGKDAEYWLSFKGASMSGAQALEKGLIDTNNNAHEVIDMALAEAARAEMAEKLGLSAAATDAEIDGRIQTLRGVETQLSTLKADLARLEGEKMALEERAAREKAQSEAAAKRASFAVDVQKACDEGLITPPRAASLLSFYDRHGEAAARDSFNDLRASAPIVNNKPAGRIPEKSTAGARTLTEDQKAHAKAIGVSETTYARDVLGYEE